MGRSGGMLTIAVRMAAGALLVLAVSCKAAPSPCHSVYGDAPLALQGAVGTLEVGKEFDALLVDGRSGAAYDVFPAITPHPLQEVRRWAADGRGAGRWGSRSAG